MEPIYSTVGIVGAGAMGRGIAQIAAQAGSRVKLLDVQGGAAQKARDAICAQWDKLVEKGRLESTVAASHKARLLLTNGLDEAATRRNRLLRHHELFCTLIPSIPRV